MMTLHPEILVKNGEQQFAVLPYEEFLALQERLAEAEDILDASQGSAAEGKKRSVALAQVKRELGLR